MRREIKYRAFIDGEMVLLPLAALQYFDFEGSYVLSFAVDGYTGFWGHEYYESATKRKCKDAPIMQYTGLKDKNGKEIYEGDIILGASFEPLIVGFCSESASFGACKNKSMIILQMYWFFNDIDIEKDGWEVIGNIYENPELITQTN